MDVVVKKSKIEGNGVFAARDFRKGDIVVRWGISHQLAPEEAASLPETEKRYAVFIGGKRILMQPPARYVNHSCDANTAPENFCDIATKDIMKGEEITANYSKIMAAADITPVFSNYASMRCRCASKNCRGIIGTQTADK